MARLGTLLRMVGLYEGLQGHFIDSLLLPFATTGQIGFRERRFLGELTRSLTSSRPIIEIGTLFGLSTTVIAEHKDRDQQLITVDNFCWNPCGLSAAAHKRLTARILEGLVESHNVELVCMAKRDFYAQYRGERPALIFLDADHSYEATREDIAWALSQRADIICGHDYANGFPGVDRAVDDSGGVERVVGTLWVLRRK